MKDFKVYGEFIDTKTTKEFLVMAKTLKDAKTQILKLNPNFKILCIYPVLE